MTSRPKICRGFSVVLLLLSMKESSGQDLAVEVRPHAKTVAFGEPLIVTAVVVNNQPNTAVIIHHNAPLLRNAPSMVDLKLGTNRNDLRRWDARLGVDRRTEPSRLAAGEGGTIELVMLYSSRDGFFAIQPGTYWIQGRIVADTGEVLSDPVPIEVREPSPEDKAAWEWINAHKEEYGRLVQVPWEAKLSEEFRTGAEELCEKTPTVYTEYVAYFLSRWYREGPGKERPDALQQSDRFAEIARAKATSDKLRAEAEKVLSASQSKKPGEQD